MVKISFQPAVAGIKADKADKASASASAPAPGPAAEILLTPTREERPPYHRHKKGGSVGSVCYLSMGMVVLLMGLVFASVYIYRYFFLAQLARDNFFHCGIFYEDSLSSQARTRMELEEDVKIYLEDNYERINESTSGGPRSATPSATSRTPSWWRRSSAGWCEGLPSVWPHSHPPVLFAYRSLAPLLPSPCLYFGRHPYP
uniref:Integral membrane protein 2 n=1 Tax=Molossus molossus TaxID=27622 RepID=A0A7J8FRS1_MOLMO|nr:integral membrane protein 2C [Molossus molossus]